MHRKTAQLVMYLSSSGLGVALIAFTLQVFDIPHSGDKKRTEAISNKLTPLAATIEEVESEMSSLNAEVARLTTKEISHRLMDTEKQINQVSAQLESLQQVISPNNASEILTVARMRDEIFARGEFETTVKGTLASFETRVNRVEDAIGRFSFWIWTTLVSVIVGLFAVAAFLSRKLARTIATVEGVQLMLQKHQLPVVDRNK